MKVVKHQHKTTPVSQWDAYPETETENTSKEKPDGNLRIEMAKI